MLISKKNRLAILSYLFKGAPAAPENCAEAIPLYRRTAASGCRPCRYSCTRIARHLQTQRDVVVYGPTAMAPPLAEGVVCAKKDFNLPKHPEIDASNLEVIKLMTSLTSRDLVSSRFSWNYYYWFLTDEGIE